MCCACKRRMGLDNQLGPQQFTLSSELYPELCPLIDGNIGLHQLASFVGILAISKVIREEWQRVLGTAHMISADRWRAEQHRTPKTIAGHFGEHQGQNQHPHSSSKGGMSSTQTTLFFCLLETRCGTYKVHRVYQVFQVLCRKRWIERQDPAKRRPMPMRALPYQA